MDEPHLIPELPAENRMSSWIPIVFALCWTTLLSCQGGVSPFGEQLPTPAELPPPQEAAQDLASSELELSRSSVPPSNAGVQDTHRPIGIESAGTGTCVWRPGGVMACVGLYESTLPPIDDVVDVWLRGGGCAIHSDRSATFWTSRYENGTLAMTMAPTKVKVAIAPHSVGIETGHAFFLSASRVYSWNLALPFEEASTMDARGARQIAFRIDEGYAVLADGSVGRWKNLGPFDETKRDFTGVEWSEMEPFDLHDVTRIFSGSRHFCALLADLSVECWGDNDLG